MEPKTQFDQVYEDRIATLQGRDRSAAGLRWNVWAEQERQGRTPCFGTEARNACRKVDCPWRRECLSLKAEWRR